MSVVFLDIDCSLCKLAARPLSSLAPAATWPVDARTHGYLVARDTANWMSSLRKLLLSSSRRDCVIWTVRRRPTTACRRHGLHLYVCNYSQSVTTGCCFSRLLDCAAAVDSRVLRLDRNCTNVQADATEWNEAYDRWSVLSVSAKRDRMLNRLLSRYPIKPAQLLLERRFLCELLTVRQKARVTRLVCSYVPIATAANFDTLCHDGLLCAAVVAVARSIYPVGSLSAQLPVAQTPRSREMDFEQQPSPPPSEQQQPPDSSFVLVLLHDVIPCNLRVGGKFLSSTIRVLFERNCLRMFLRCYGFMLYNRAEKVQTFAANSDPAVREVAQLLGEVHDVESFRQELYANISWAKLLLTDEVADSLAIDDQDVATVLRHAVDEEAGGATGPEDVPKQTGRQLLELARYTLEHVLSFLRDTDYLRRAINTNEYCRQLLAGADSSQAGSHMRDAWYNSQECDFNACLSIIVRDAIISTSEETHHTLLFAVRSALLFVFLVTQTICGPGSRAVTVTVNLPAVNSGGDGASAAEYFERLETITTEKMIATIFIAIARMGFVTALEWPCRLLENNGLTVDMGAIHGTLTHKLKMRRASSLRWLRVFAQRKGERASRLYCNPNALTSMWAKISQCIDAASSLSDQVGGDVSIRITSLELRRQYADYEALLALCAQSIAANIRTHEHGLRPRDYAGTSPQFLAATAVAGDLDQFERDVADTLVFSVLALIRHDVIPFAQRFDSVNFAPENTRRLLAYNETLDSYAVMLQHTYEHFYRAKISVGQTKQFISQMVTIWNESLGIAGFEQLGAIMLLVYQMFPNFNASLDTAPRASNQF